MLSPIVLLLLAPLCSWASSDVPTVFNGLPDAMKIAIGAHLTHSELGNMALTNHATRHVLGHNAPLPTHLWPSYRMSILQGPDALQFALRIVDLTPSERSDLISSLLRYNKFPAANMLIAKYTACLIGAAPIIPMLNVLNVTDADEVFVLSRIHAAGRSLPPSWTKEQLDELCTAVTNAHSTSEVPLILLLRSERHFDLEGMYALSPDSFQTVASAIYFTPLSLVELAKRVYNMGISVFYDPVHDLIDSFDAASVDEEGRADISHLEMLRELYRGSYAGFNQLTRLPHYWCGAAILNALNGPPGELLDSIAFHLDRYPCYLNMLTVLAANNGRVGLVRALHDHYGTRIRVRSSAIPQGPAMQVPIRLADVVLSRGEDPSITCWRLILQHRSDQLVQGFHTDTIEFEAELADLMQYSPPIRATIAKLLARVDNEIDPLRLALILLLSLLKTVLFRVRQGLHL